MTHVGIAFTPAAIREHFAQDTKIQHMTDDELLLVGERAAGSTNLQHSYDQALREALDDEFAYVSSCPKPESKA